MVVPNGFVNQVVGKNRIKLVALLGEGSYGCVYRGIFHQQNVQKECAVKCMAMANLSAYHLMVQRREIILHQKVSDGQGIVTFYETFEEHDHQFIVMEYCDTGDLWEQIANGRYYGKDNMIRDVLTQILTSVEYCHSKRVFHRDLKPENILLTEGGKKVLLADFGLASGSPMSNEMRCGSPWYMSPECWGVDILELPYNTASNDVWALGVLLVNIVCARHVPWKQATHRDPFFQNCVQQPGLLRSILPMSSEVHDLLDRVFVVDSATRISLQDFKLTVQNIKHFTPFAAKREGFHGAQRKIWNNAIRPPPLQPLVTKTLRLITAASAYSSSEDESGSLDITDIANYNWKSFILPAPSSHSFNSFVCEIPILDASSRSLRHVKKPSLPRHSVSSLTESEGPITPEMPPTVMNLDIPDITVVSQDLCNAVSELIHTTQSKTSPIQDIPQVTTGIAL